MTGLRVATWNLWWHFGPWEERQPAIVETMRAVDADIWCLQEVFRGNGHPDQADALAETLGGYHAAHESRFPPDRFADSIGNAVLSRWPITRSEMRPLPAPEGLDELRCVVRADIDAPVGRLEVFSLHFNYRLDQSHVRQAQVRALCEFVGETASRRTYPPIVGGDANADPESEEVRMLTGLTTVPTPGLVFLDAWRAAGTGPGSTWDNRNPFAADDHEPDGSVTSPCEASGPPTTVAWSPTCARERRPARGRSRGAASSASGAAAARDEEPGGHGPRDRRSHRPAVPSGHPAPPSCTDWLMFALIGENGWSWQPSPVIPCP
jgi:endonuclease/exonuclease/phosphatase family metal-dependent hydrolase